MDFYMYKSICPNIYWYGNTVNIRHIVVPENTSETDVVNMSRDRANAASGSRNCKVELLQKYFMSIEPKKSYVGLTGLHLRRISVATPVGWGEDLKK
jgi:hypothetical protein